MPAENLIGREGEGFKIAMFALDQGRYTVAAGATGLIRACRDASVKYAQERQTFGVPIGEHQLVKEMIARMEATIIRPHMWLRAGWMKTSHAATRARPAGQCCRPSVERDDGDAVQIPEDNATRTVPVGALSHCKGR